MSRTISKFNINLITTGLNNSKMTQCPYLRPFSEQNPKYSFKKLSLLSSDIYNIRLEV